VVYEYANRLVDRGHSVSVVHTSRGERYLSVPASLRRRGAHVARRLLGAHGPSPWFTLDSRVRQLWVPALTSRHVPDGDAMVATAWQTAEWAAGYPAVKGAKFYLIQGLETWSGPEVRVMATWKLPLVKIVISRALQEVAVSLGESCHYIPNGLDFEAFGVDTPIESRRPGSFLMLHHPKPWKGSRFGMIALRRVRDLHPGAAIHLFGTGREPSDLPPGFVYHRSPGPERLRALYNQASIFVSPSLTEGWPLPPAEAMACGCALAATDIGGHREYAVSGETALLSPPGEPDALAADLLRLVEDDGLRVQLAHGGLAHIRQFTWERAADAFERALRTPA